MSDQFYRLLSDLKEKVADDLQKTELLISDRSENKVSCVTEVIRHLILSGGKRIRPILLLTFCKMLDFQEEKKVLIAAAIECIHSATLLHDDVVDKSERRRGVSTSSTIWGNKTSVLVGDFLFATAFQWVISCENLDLLSILSEASSTIIIGEIQQMLYSHSIDVTREQYLEIISAKTAALFSATCEAAAVASRTSHTIQSALKSFGYHFGISFQIMDDLLDYTAQNDKFSKKIGDDFYEGKVTLPLIIAYEDASPEEKAFWRESVGGNLADFEAVSSRLLSGNTIKKSVELAKYHANIAKTHLQHFPDSQYKSGLSALLDGMTQRRF